ncbi:tripartite tricarboxylate transporter substrate-binding protein [Roseomonas fluvialis]|uniref:Exported protein n=1 Tax=Roseomonas fluvialis TaxID=1750527 RepID=A0ABN6P0S4_9PROT|nr:tripartite tricarboxylate transporter substrate-binding protein [Roseomonas fluvialis]BDG72164.1 exported protein [Roseomonas fluvialis]
MTIAAGRRAVIAAAIATPMAPRIARAAWPERAVRIVVAFPPGSSTDVVARALAQKLAEGIGQAVVVENRGGAGGNLGAQAVKAATDGHTLLMHSTAISVNPTLYRNAGYTLDDFSAVAVVATAPNAFFVHPSVPATTLAELLTWMRANPGAAYAHSGTGTTPHLGAELLFRTLAGVQATPVAFGPAQAATAVVGNQAPIGSTSLPPALPLIREGRVRGIAVAGARRDPTLPDVPTVAEQGFPGFEASTWFGLFAPARTPTEGVQRLLAEVPRAMAAPDLVARLAALSLTDPGLHGDAAAAYARAEAARWAEVVRSSGATAE